MLVEMQIRHPFAHRSYHTMLVTKERSNWIMHKWIESVLLAISNPIDNKCWYNKRLGSNSHIEAILNLTN